MLAATYTQGHGFQIADIPRPRIGADELLVRVRAAAICGTDVKTVRNGGRRLKPGQRIVLGHEFAGTVEEVGSAVVGFAVGDRIGAAPNFGCGRCEACLRGMSNLCPDYSAFGIDTDGAHAACVRIPAAAVRQGNVVQLPADLAWEEAALAEPLSCVLNGQRVVHLAAGETVVVYGVGPMGLLHVLLARACGAGRVIAVDTNPARLAKACELGADTGIHGATESVPERVKAVSAGRGADVVILAASVAALVPEALTLLAPFGRLCLFAGLPAAQAAVPLDANAIHYRNLVVTGSSGGCNADYRTALDLIATRRVDVRPAISHRFPLARMAEAYETAQAGQGMKIVLVDSPPRDQGSGSDRPEPRTPNPIPGNEV